MSGVLAINGGKPVREDLLGYGRQVITEADIANVLETLNSEFLTCGPAVDSFEGALKQATGAKFVTAVANGTAALHIACLAAGIKPGDEVIVSPITFAASANAILYCGAKPVFADIDEYTWNISPEAIEEAITDKTKAIIAVDFGGVLVDADAIHSICNKCNLIFIEDAAHSIGSALQGRPVGSLADITTFSFHPVKTITTGEGGAVASNDTELAQKIELYAKHGITRNAELMNNPDGGGWYYEQLRLGYNYRLSDIQAALGLSQLARLDDFAKRRREIVAQYQEAFKTIPEISFQLDKYAEETVRHLFCLRFNGEALNGSRRFIYDALQAEGIGVNVHYIPVYRLPYYQDLGYEEGLCPNAERYYEEAITLPLHCAMSDQDVQDVICAVKKMIDFCR